MTHKALIVGGPRDGEEVEFSGAFFLIQHPDGKEKKYEHRMCVHADRKWFFLVEHEVTAGDIMEALYKRYRNE